MNRIIQKIGFFSAFILPLLLVTGFYAGGAWNFLTVAFVFIGIPLLDYLLGEDKQNPAKTEEQTLTQDAYYRFVNYTWVFVQWGLLLWASYMFAVSDLSTVAQIGFVLSLALITGGIGITVAHELGHKQGWWQRFYAKILLSSVWYMHFYIEHNLGHHVHVSTPKDSATSRENESFYAFWWRSVSGGYRSAWQIEKQRMQRQGKPAYALSNRMWLYSFLPPFLILLIVLAVSWIVGFFAWQVGVMLLIQSVLGFSLLEAVNYLEHYGLMRREISPGRYERVNHLHSWNNSHLLSNFFLFQLQRHSDHHAFAVRPYQILRHHEESPQLPAGYPTMILLALVPPLWFRVMNPRLQAWKKQVSRQAAA
ncbi:MAG: alkane 1-monooxygenase [Bernardetiaceae bacterium]|nr:alkane 1-monooxygenase [Bernardetiaceae bacterium]